MNRENLHSLLGWGGGGEDEVDGGILDDICVFFVLFADMLGDSWCLIFLSFFVETIAVWLYLAYPGSLVLQ